MKKIFLIAFLFLFGQQAFADVVSLSSNYVAGEASVITHLNNDRTALANGVNNVRGVFSGGVQSSGQIKADTVGEENMADDANPRIRTSEGAWCNDFTYTGLLPTTTSGTLVGSVPAGTGYPSGYRVVKSGATAHTFSASKWTWVDMDTSGSFTFLEQAIGSVAPSVTANSMRLARVSTDSTQVTAVQDLRVTSCSTGPFSILSDASGEATLSDMFVKGNIGWMNGLNIVSGDASSVVVRPGSAYVLGDYKALLGSKTVSITTAGNSITGIDGIDSGSVAANTTYYIYATADIDSTKPPIVLFSTNASAPAGPTKYRKIGEATTDAGKGFTITSADTTSINYLGKIRQVKMRKNSAVVTASSTIPDDNTTVQNTEGFAALTLPFTAVSADNTLVFDVDLNWTVTAGGGTVMAIALCRSGDANCFDAKQLSASTNISSNTHFTFQTPVHTVAQETYTVRLGTPGDAYTLNGGGSGVAKLNGTIYSTLKITEMEQ